MWKKLVTLLLLLYSRRKNAFVWHPLSPNEQVNLEKTRRIRELQYYHTIAGLKDTAVFFDGDSEGISPHILPGHCSDHSVVKYNSHDQRQHELCPAVTLDIPSCQDALASAIGWCTAGFAYDALASAGFAYDAQAYIQNCGLMQETQSHEAIAESLVQETHLLLRNTSRGSLFLATMSMTVKAYLLGKDDCNKEIRRFAVDQDVSTSFEYLKRKVLDVFVGLGTAPFQMYYKGKSVFLLFLIYFM